MKIGLMGAGAMGEAIVAAVTRSDPVVATASDVCVFDISRQRMALLQSDYGVQTAAEPAGIVDGADAVIFAVKPQDFEKAAASIAEKLGSATVV